MKSHYNYPSKIADYGKKSQHLLSDVLFTALLSFLSNGRNYGDMAFFARLHENFLREFVPSENGIPSREVFSRVFSVLEPDLFRNCLYVYKKGITEILSRKKIVRGIRNVTIITQAEKNGPPVLQARVAENSLCFAPKKSVKQTAASAAALIEGLTVRDAVVSVDTGDCQREFASLIVRKGGHYFLPLREEAELYNAVVDCFDSRTVNRSSEIREYDNGRIEILRCGIIDAKGVFPERTPGRPEGLKTLIKTDSVSVVKGKDTRHTHYYISSETEAAYINILMSIHGVTSSHPVNGKHMETDLLHILFKDEPHFHVTQEDADGGNARENLFFLKRFAVQINKETGILNRTHFNADADS